MKLNFLEEGNLDSPKYWNSNLNWSKRNFTPDFFIIKNILESLK